MSTKQKHKERAHAVLSASSASRWLNCTPSAKLSEGLESPTSVHADEGTLAHELSENILRKRLGIIDEVTFNNRNRELVAHKLFDIEMMEPVESYVDFCMEVINEASSQCPDLLVNIEEKVSLEVYIEQGFGTCDLVIIADGMMYVIDLKFGKGVRVSAIDNSQLKLYAVGALEAHGMLYDTHTVRMIIVQPRMDAISTFDMPAEDLLIWAEEFVKPQAEKAFKGEGEHTPGDWCRFCKAKTICPALREEALLLAEADFDPNVNAVDELDLLEVYKIAGRVESYLEAVKAHIYQRAMDGVKFPGLKLVYGQSRRTIQDEQAVLKILKEKGYETSMFYKEIKKLVGLKEIEKYIGKKAMAEHLGHLIVKPQGKPTLVDESDKREAINHADDFLD